MWPFHRHVWTITSAQRGTFVLFGGPGTQVNLRCECGKIRQETLNGWWTEDELKGAKL